MFLIYIFYLFDLYIRYKLRYVIRRLQWKQEWYEKIKIKNF